MKKQVLKKTESTNKVNNQVKKTSTSSKVKTSKKVETPKAKEQKVIKEVETQQKASLIEVVAAHREVKYLYPSDVQDTLSRKQWRQKVRNKLQKLEKVYLRIKDENSKEYKEALKAFEEYRSQVMKPAAEMV